MLSAAADGRSPGAGEQQTKFPIPVAGGGGSGAVQKVNVTTVVLTAARSLGKHGDGKGRLS